MRLRAAAVAFALVTLVAARAAAEPPPLPPPTVAPLAPGESLRVEGPSTLVTDLGGVIRLPPVLVIGREAEKKLDAELRRLQTIETRLSAENASLRDSAGWGWGSWLAVGTALAAGAAGGYWLSTRGD